MLGRQLLPPLSVAVVLGVIGLVSLWTQQPLLAPSVGSAVFVQVMTPTEPSARAWNTAAGQIIGVGAGMTGVFAAAATVAPTFLANHLLVFDRVLAMIIAVLLTVIFEMLLRATSPAGGATAVLIAIGGESADWAGAGRLLAGILLVTLLGEAARLLILRTRQG